CSALDLDLMYDYRRESQAK
ncbi:unnamed protein product, partial [Rotaria sp. Silwood1]